MYKSRKIAFFMLGALFFLALFYFLFLSAPRNFPSGIVISIERGSNLRSASLLLKEQNIIRSRAAFEAFVIIYGGEKHIISSDYYFENKLPVYEVARRISRGEHRMVPVLVTIPEGYSAAQIADTFVSKLANFNKKEFLSDAKTLEGYLFPDTYFFLTTDNEKDVLNSMNGNFEKKIAPLFPTIISSGKSENDIIIMASVIEKEAKGDIDREVISGILWKRISVGMPLQVDSAPETYKSKGLPKSPIGNPGLLAIRASVSPKNSPYLYYLHDKNGNIHYAKNLSEHQANIKKYLK